MAEGTQDGKFSGDFGVRELRTHGLFASGLRALPQCILWFFLLLGLQTLENNYQYLLCGKN